MPDRPRQFAKPAGAGLARCRSCFYVLEGLDSGFCPECARPFDSADPASFTTRVPFVGWVFWLPPLVLCAAGSLLVAAVLVFGLGQWGWAVWVAVPFAGGSVLGYRFRSRWFILPILGLMLVVTIIFGLMTLQLAGVYCGLALMGVLLGPTFAGIVTGTLLRGVLKRTAFTQRSWLPVIGLFLLPFAAALLEHWLRGPPVAETAATSRHIDADPASCFDSLLFYEDVSHEPPWILRVGLARPQHVTGPLERPGDVRTCIYNKGRIVKRVTAVEEGRRLAFEVIEQSIGYERDLRLRGGSFSFEATADGGTLVTLTTTYEPLLAPRWCWRPFERIAARTLHAHVLEGIAAEAAARSGAAASAVAGAGADRAHRD